ncbi:hypothetical protein [Corynebacterium frankenforstense]
MGHASRTGASAHGTGVEGREYVIRYSLSPYQHGSMVGRFAGEPSKADVRSFLAGYSIDAAKLSDVSVTPVPDFRHRRPVGGAPAPQRRAPQAPRPAGSPAAGAQPPRHTQSPAARTTSAQSSAAWAKPTQPAGAGAQWRGTGRRQSNYPAQPQGITFNDLLKAAREARDALR